MVRFVMGGVVDSTVPIAAVLALLVILGSPVAEELFGILVGLSVAIALDCGIAMFGSAKATCVGVLLEAIMEEPTGK